MRKLVLKMAMSLDGFVAGPNGEADWIFRHGSAESRDWTVDILGRAGVHAMGSRSYHDMAGFWPYSDSPFAKPMNDIPKVVFSRSGIKKRSDSEQVNNQQKVSPTEAVLRSWAEPTIAAGDLAEEIARLKGEPGNFVLAHGGASFAQSLVSSGMIDEYRLSIIPVALGRGLPLFSSLPRPLNLKLVSRVTFGSGGEGVIFQPE